MAHAYTPGLEVLEKKVIIKERKLPLKGEVLVSVGDMVKSEDIVAKTELPGNPELVNIANKLGIEAGEVPECMLKKIGDFVENDEDIAISKGLFGLFRTKCKSPIRGTIEHISDTTGKVLVRAPAIPVEVRAFIDGEIIEVMPNEGVVIKSFGSSIQGIFGVGGEMVGEIAVAVDDPSQELETSMITDAFKDKIVLGGSLVTYDTLQAAIKAGVKGVIVGGFDDADLKKFLGYDLGVAITGSEKLGVTLVVTEGFGRIRMADKTFELLKSAEGKKASINGATQIRAGVIRPEIIVCKLDMKDKTESIDEESAGMVKGSTVRIIREPRFGELAEVVSLPVPLTQVQSETKVRVVEVEFRDGKRWVLPRANVEII